jgi:serine/threonine protein phosphatase PrpC
VDWKIVSASVCGLSHQEADLPCQDYHLVESRSLDGTVDGQKYLLACVSDGAGSAKHSEIGSKLSCQAFSRIVRENEFRFFDDDHLLDTDLFASWARSWCRSMRAELAAEAQALDVPVRALACTFLAAIIFDNFACFLQIGDGDIVLGDQSGYSHVFWPQSGEYANTTNFITSDNWHVSLETAYIKKNFQSLAMLSDGLERLALSFSDEAVHSPFFCPFFDAPRT